MFCGASRQPSRDSTWGVPTHLGLNYLGDNFLATVYNDFAWGNDFVCYIAGATVLTGWNNRLVCSGEDSKFGTQLRFAPGASSIGWSHPCAASPCFCFLVCVWPLQLSCLSYRAWLVL
jgi:hypothetical protein